MPRQIPQASRAPRVTGPRMPESVLRKRPAEIVAPPPGTITGPLPPPPTWQGRNTFRATPPQLARAKAQPRPIRGRKPMPIGLIALALLFLGLFVVAMGLGAATGIALPDLFDSTADKPPPRAFPVLEPSRPQKLSIPAINVQAPILEVGLTSDGSAVDVPPLRRHNEAGWFDGGPTPGQFGPAVIVGHADTKTGPSVFHDLPRLKPGQRIEVQRADDSVAVFEINSVEHYNKGRLPVHRVYGDYSRPSLRLMTCGGQWLGGHYGYSDNVIVFASLVDTKKA